MSIRIRRAGAAEGERLRDIARASKAYWGYDPARVAEWANSMDFSADGLASRERYAAEIDGRVVGWSAIIPKDDVCWLDDLWIEPDWIGKGVGTELFRHAVGRGRELGLACIELEAEPNAIGFYEKMGARFIRDSEPTEWGRIIPIMGLDIRPNEDATSRENRLLEH